MASQITAVQDFKFMAHNSYKHLIAFSLRFNGHFASKPGLAGHTGAKDDRSAGHNWSYKTCKAPFKLSPPTKQHPTSYTPDANI